jgi:hypothetical protein
MVALQTSELFPTLVTIHQEFWSLICTKVLEKYVDCKNLSFKVKWEHGARIINYVNNYESVVEEMLNVVWKYGIDTCMDPVCNSYMLSITDMTANLKTR